MSSIPVLLQLSIEGLRIVGKRSPDLMAPLVCENLLSVCGNALYGLCGNLFNSDLGNIKARSHICIDVASVYCDDKRSL